MARSPRAAAGGGGVAGGGVSCEKTKPASGRKTKSRRDVDLMQRAPNWGRENLSNIRTIYLAVEVVKAASRRSFATRPGPSCFGQGRNWDRARGRGGTRLWHRAGDRE